MADRSDDAVLELSPIDPAVVVGAGLSGLATALGVALRGRPVVVLEADELVGGAAAFSGGQVWVGGKHVAAREGIDDDLERAERYVRAIAQEQPEFLDEQAMRRWLTTAPEAAKYWEDVGAIRWTVIPGLADYHGAADDVERSILGRFALLRQLRPRERSLAVQGTQGSTAVRDAAKRSRGRLLSRTSEAVARRRARRRRPSRIAAHMERLGRVGFDNGRRVSQSADAER